MKKLAIANQKGGVGKSTLAVHVAFAAVEAGLRVLLVDMDKQGSLSLIFVPAKDAAPGLLSSTLYEAETTGQKPEYITDKLAIIRADERLALLDSVPDSFIKRPALHLKQFENDFDVCIIDTPGLIGAKLNAALAAVDAVVCPVSVGLFESAGLAELWRFIKNVKTKGYNPRLRVMGMIPSKVNTRSAEEKAALQELRDHFGNAILPITLAERASVKQSIMRRKPVWRGTKGAGHIAAAKEWKAACNYILANLGSSAK